MSGYNLVSAESLLKEELPRSGGKAYVLLAFVAGLGFAGLLSHGIMPVTQEPSINMAWPSMQARPSQSILSTKVAALPGPHGLTDIRRTLFDSPAQKCVFVNKHASLCGDLVLLRPSTALRAEADGKAQTADAKQVLEDVKKRFDAIEDKPQAALYAGGALVALTTVNGILSSVNAIPLIPSLLETVGIGYSGWFAYRYLFTKNSRDELGKEIDELKKKISGEE